MKPPSTLVPSSNTKKSDIAIRAAVWGLFILTALVYGRICSHEFTWWDDDITIHHNRHFDPPTPRDVLWYWSHPEAGMYIPVVYTVWGWLAVVAYDTNMDDYGSHLKPSVYHYASLLAHIGTVLMVFVVLRRLLRKDWAAFAGAALYAVHPVQVETVAWATSLKEGLCGLFGVLSLWYYLRAADEGGALTLPVSREKVGAMAISVPSEDQPSPSTPGADDQSQLESTVPPVATSKMRRRRVALYLTSAFMLLLAQLSNPLAVVIPPMAFVIDALVLRRPWRRAAAWAGPLVALSIIDAVICRIVQPGVVAPDTPLWIRPLVATDTLAFYISKLFFPLHLCTEYARRPDLALARGWLYWTWILPVAVAGVVWFFGRCRPMLVAGALLALIGVGPVLGLIPFDMQQYSTPADRYLYLAMLGPALIIGAWFSRPRPTWQRAAWGVVIAVLAVRSFFQVGTWRDDMTLWRHTVAVSPDSFVARSNLGADYNRLSDRPGSQSAWYLSLAVAEYRKAVQMHHDFFKAHDNLSMAYARLGMTDDAIVEMKESVRLGDRLFGVYDCAQARITLAGMLIQNRRPDEAMVYLNQAKKLAPNLPGLDYAFEHARDQPQTRPTTRANR